MAPGLVEVLLADLAPDTDGNGAHEPGALPMLSHALLTAWEHSHGGTLTVADYLAGGGIKEALTRSAERAYESLAPSQQLLARRLFLRLVHVADELPPSRAAVSLGELLSGIGDGADAEQVLAVFIDERMITVDTGAARLTHDALLTAWPRLRAWIEESAEELRTRRRISSGARAWAEAGREEAALWRGSQLAVAREWAEDPDKRAALLPLAGEFVGASVAAGTARERLERRRTTRLRSIVAVLTVLVVAVCLLAGYAFKQRQQATAARDVAITAQQDANSREVANEAAQLRALDPPLAAQLSVAAYGIARTQQATAALLESTDAAAAARIADSSGIVQAVAVSPDRRLLAAAGADGTLRLWNVTDPGHATPVGQPLQPANSDLPLYTVAFSPDGKVLAAAGAGREVKLWDVSNPARPVPLGAPLTGPRNTIYSVAFSPDGHTLAAASADDTVRLWNVTDPARARPLGRPLTGPTGYVQTVAFSADGGLLAAGSGNSVAGGPRRHRLGVERRRPGSPAAAARHAADRAGLGGIGGGVQPVRRPARRVQPGRQGLAVEDLRRRPGGARRHAGQLDELGEHGRVQPVRRLPGGRDVGSPGAGLEHGHPRADRQHGAAAAGHHGGLGRRRAGGGGRRRRNRFDMDASRLRCCSPATRPLRSRTHPMAPRWPSAGPASSSGRAASRTLIASHPLPAAAYVNGIAFAPSGDYLAVAYGNGTAQLLDARTLAPVSKPFAATSRGAVESVAYSPEGSTIATSADDGSVRLWSVTDPAHPRQLSAVPDSGASVYTIAFAPNGRTLAAASLDDFTRLWNVADPARPQRLGKPLGGMHGYAIGLAFSPSSGLLAVGSQDGTVHLWNVRDPARATPVGAPLTGPAGYVWAAAFSPDGRTLAVGVTDGSVWMWNVADPAHPSLVASLTGPASHVYSVAFSPSGAQLAATSYEGTVHLWDTGVAAASAAVCGNLGQPITTSQWATLVPGVPYRAPCG